MKKKTKQKSNFAVISCNGDQICIDYVTAGTPRGAMRIVSIVRLPIHWAVYSPVLLRRMADDIEDGTHPQTSAQLRKALSESPKGR